MPAPTVLHADDELLVVDKPAGALSVHGRGDHPLLADLLRAQRLVPDDEPFRIVHRIDLDASGVIVYARTLNAQQKLTEQFATREVEKLYVALASGYVPEDGSVSLPILGDGESGRAKVDPRRGKPARTDFRILERIVGHTLLECFPHTGRLHQIRVHLAAIGHPLAVDPVYGGCAALLLSTYKSNYKPSARHEERPLIARLTLHAARISFEHPAGSGRVAFEAPLPKDLRATLTQLRRL